jgi:hypothetical protein
MGVKIEYTPGQKLGECVFIRESGSKRKSNGDLLRLAAFQCQCGKEFISEIIYVKTLKTTSCGCGIIRDLKKHRYGNEAVRPMPEYNIWILMRARCNNETSKSFKNYGGRGISVCARWNNSFSDFLADVGPRPSPQHSLDRYPNNDGNYEPGNVRWATDIEQSRNKRSNVIISYMGESMCIAEWAEKLDIPAGKIAERYSNGRSLEDVFSKGMLSTSNKNRHQKRTPVSENKN